ncbi:unnamed protein product [Nezara viridula]|uniref:Uncharacterized protein n=1 Tax=Nezara viridula TaxID=85310 RepID=A0A9P0HC41_NEZVI|nr:unnamed protein product [Nezara viridula]
MSPSRSNGISCKQIEILVSTFSPAGGWTFLGIAAGNVAAGVQAKNDSPLPHLDPPITYTYALCLKDIEVCNSGTQELCNNGEVGADHMDGCLSFADIRRRSTIDNSCRRLLNFTGLSYLMANKPP